jgi:hypothetical protein
VITIEAEQPGRPISKRALDQLGAQLADLAATVAEAGPGVSGYRATFAIEARSALDAVRSGQSEFADAVACTDLPPVPITAIHVRASEDHRDRAVAVGGAAGQP